MEIGIMGGTFDPIHNGHLMLGEYAYQRFDLDEVWFMPNGHPPHKDSPDIVKDTQDRVRMTALAIEDVPYFRLCTYEADRKEKSYSYQTIERLKKEFPEHRFYFILGADSLFTIEEWRHADRLIKSVAILAAYRDDIDTSEEMNRQISYLNEKYGGDIRLLRTPLLPVSSHEIREQIENGIWEELPIPEKVTAYIQEHQLYRGGSYDRDTE